MSNPTEKAKELVNKMTGFTFEDCKYNALVAVEEIIKVCHYNSKENLSNWELVGLDDFEFSCYWQEVKQEINKL